MRASKVFHGLVEKFEAVAGKKAGLIYMLMQAFLFTLQDLGAKLLPRIPSFSVTYLRALIMYLIQLLYINKYDIEVLRKNPILHRAMMLRGIFGFIGLSAFFYSLKVISLMEASTIFNLSPMLIGIFGAIYLKEPFGRLEILSAVMGFIGFLLIVRPPFIFSYQASSEPTSDADYFNHLLGEAMAFVTAISMTVVS